MGVDIETYRGRIGTFKLASGVDVIVLQCTVNFTGCLKAVGSLAFIGILLVMAGIEQNPGPTEQGNRSAESDTVVIYSRKDLNQPLYKNWVRSATGFNYLKSGLQTFISRKVQEQHEDILKRIGPAATRCTSCTADNLMPGHPTRTCAQKYRNKCFCKDHHGRRKCPSNFCSKFYDEVVRSHAEANPLWRNVETTRWYDNFFEFAKCFVSTTGYRERHSATEVDALGLLSIAINDLYIHDAIHELDLFEKVRETRHEIFHTKSFEVTDEQLRKYIDEMIDVLQDAKCLANDPDAQQAVKDLERLKANQIYISEEDASAIRNIALEAITESKNKAIYEIENARASAIQDIDSRQEEKGIDADTRLFKRQELRKYIIGHYEQYYSTIDVSPLIRSKEIPIDELYTPLIIVSDNEVEKDPEFGDCDEYVSYFGVGGLRYIRRHAEDEYIKRFPRHQRKAFSRNIEKKYGEGLLQHQQQAFFHNSNLLRNVFLTGEAGLGKTTLCKKILSVWCSINKVEKSSTPSRISVGLDWGLDSFQFVFYICLRDTNNESSLEEMVKGQLLPSKYHDTFKDILEHVPEECLFICDGLDEWNPPEDMPKSPTTSPGLPLRNSKSKFVTLFTARSWKLDTIRPTSGEVDAVLNIKGIFSKRELIEKLLGLLDKTSNKQFTVDTFIEDVKRREHLMLLMETPLVLKLIVFLWHDKQTLNESLTCVYSDIIELFLRHADLRNNRDHDFQDEAYTHKADISPNISIGRPYIQKHSYLLSKLSKFAFETLYSKDKQTRLIFKTSELFSYGIPKHELVNLLKQGILSLHMVAGSSRLEEEKEVTFTHATFQEYFAACYITSNSDIRIQTILRHQCTGLGGIYNLKTFLVFLSGMDPSALHRISTIIADIWNNDVQASRHRHFPSSSADNISDVLFTCLREAKHVPGKDARIIVSDIIYTSNESGQFWNVDWKEAKSLTITNPVLDTDCLVSCCTKLETLKDFSTKLPVKKTLLIIRSSRECLKYVFLRKGLQTLSYQYLAEIRKIIQNMHQLQYIDLENVIHFKSTMALDRFLRDSVYHSVVCTIRFHGVCCLPYSTKLQVDDCCNIVVKVDKINDSLFTIEESSKCLFPIKDCKLVTSMKNEIPIKWLTDYVNCLHKFVLVDVKMPFLYLKSLFEKARFLIHCKDMQLGTELIPCAINKNVALCTVDLNLNVKKKKINHLSVSDLEQQDDPEHLLSFLKSDYRIQQFKSSSHVSHLNVFMTDSLDPNRCHVDCVNMKLRSIASVLSWIMNFPNTEIFMTSEHLCFTKIPQGVDPSALCIKFSNTSHSFIRKIKPYLLQNGYVLEFHLKNVFLEDSSLDFDLHNITCLTLETMILTFETLTGILNRLKDGHLIYIPSDFTVNFSDLIVVGKRDVVHCLVNCPEISVEYYKELSQQIYVREKVIAFKNVSEEDISNVRRVLQFFNFWKDMLGRPFSLISLNHLNITQKTLKIFISSLNKFGNELEIELNKIMFFQTNGDESENIETCLNDWMPRFHVIDDNGMLWAFKEACMVRILVCMTEENDNVNHLMRLLPTCQCLQELRLLDININNMTFNFNSEMKSLKRVYFSRIKATCAPLSTLLERIPMPDQDVMVYLNNVFLLDKSPQVFLDTVLNMKQVHVETFSKVKPVFPDKYFFFNDTEDDSQLFRMTVRKQFIYREKSETIEIYSRSRKAQKLF